MKKFIRYIVVLFSAHVLLCGLNHAWAKSAAKNDGNDQLLRRIDFGSSHIMGQTIKSGAVYLMQRKKSDVKSMLKHREDYRKEILEDFNIQDKETKAKLP